MDHARIQLFPLAITLRNLKVDSFPPDPLPMLEAQQVILRMNPTALLQGQILIQEIRIEAFHGFLHRFANGTDNLFSPTLPTDNVRLLRQNTAPTPWQWHIEHISLTQGTITVRDDASGYNASLHQFQAQLGPITPTLAMPIELSTAWEKAEAHGTLQIQHAQLSIHPIRLKALHLEATAAGPNFHIPRIQGEMDLTISPQQAASASAWGWIRALAGTVMVELHEATIAGFNVARMQARGEAQQGVVTITQATAQVAQGQISLNATFDGQRSLPKVIGALKAQDIDLGLLLAGLGQREHVRGRLAVDAQCSGQGTNPSALRSTLTGHVQILLENATIPNIPLRESLGTLAPLLVSPTFPSRIDVAVHHALAQGPIHQGVFRAAVSGHGPWFTLRGAANFHLTSNYLSGTFQLTATPQAAQDIGPAAALVQGVPIPVQVQGPIHNLTIQADPTSLLRQHGPAARPGKPPTQIPELLQRLLRP